MPEGETRLVATTAVSDPALDGADAWVLGSPAAHGLIGRLQLTVDDFVGDGGELLLMGLLACD